MRGSGPLLQEMTRIWLLRFSAPRMILFSTVLVLAQPQRLLT